MYHNRRQFLKNTSLTAFSGIILPGSVIPLLEVKKKIRILVWDERSDEQKEAYDNFLGNYIADQLKANPEFSVASVGLDDADQGIPDSTLDQTDLLIWWGHVRQDEISPEKGKNIVERIKAGTLAFIALHSAHWSTPFVQAMNEITRLNVLKDSPVKSTNISFIAPPKQFTVPHYDARITPYTVERKFPDGQTKLQVHLPFCCFPAYRNDGKPSTVKVLQPGHPIMAGLPASFLIPQTEMYDEPFHVPAPDSVIFEESWATGEWFRSGMLWELGKGKIFYFRPGHETFPVFKEKNVLNILSNAAKWIVA
ncbi:ThuA domain-containing protein [Flavihumibacter fluvii]|uniref:ThuA domain-containing protein n=1 Tax=Flavihumibacter fluvii TaxID=2838157 RepID=UPI001BDE72C3|nr:ThuA domain-containing protein [Flavihumibacter fluvii]ULQ53251.1 ThuA domain-containing protein [Flavihumibacter fluvii]